MGHSSEALPPFNYAVAGQTGSSSYHTIFAPQQFAPGPLQNGISALNRPLHSPLDAPAPGERSEGLFG